MRTSYDILLFMACLQLLMITFVIHYFSLLFLTSSVIFSQSMSFEFHLDIFTKLFLPIQFYGMSEIVKTEAVVLYKIKYGDTSIIVTLFTKDYGKMKIHVEIIVGQFFESMA